MPTPAQLARQSIRELKKAGNPADAEQSRYYFKSHEKVSFFGVKSPTVKEIEKNLHQLVVHDWQLNEALEFCEILLHKRELEAKGVGLLLLSRYRKSFDRSLINNVERWLDDCLCNNWATTDGMCSLISSPLVGRFPDLLMRLDNWAGKKNLWLRRAAVVTLVPLVRHGQNLDFAYDLSQKVLTCPEDLMHKANGWMLREAGKADAKRLEDFLLTHGPLIPRTTVRYAIEKFDPAKRKRILQLTRP